MVPFILNTAGSFLWCLSKETAKYLIKSYPYSTVVSLEDYVFSLNILSVCKKLQEPRLSLCTLTITTYLRRCLMLLNALRSLRCGMGEDFKLDHLSSELNILYHLLRSALNEWKEGQALCFDIVIQFDCLPGTKYIKSHSCVLRY